MATCLDQPANAAQARKAYDKLKSPELAAKAREYAKQISGSPVEKEDKDPPLKREHPPLGT